MAQLLKPAHERLLEYVLGKPVVGADETWWRLMGAKAKRDGGDGAKWWVWCVGADDAVCYRLEDSRSAAAASRLLGEYSGTVMCDGFSSYISLAKSTRKFRLAHCWSHVRGSWAWPGSEKNYLSLPKPTSFWRFDGHPRDQASPLPSTSASFSREERGQKPAARRGSYVGC